MEKKFGLSETEYELMEYFWTEDRNLSFKEIFEYFNNVKDKNWKKQTLSTFLTILKENGHIGADMSGRKYFYYPLRSKNEHVTMWIRGVCKEFFNNSIGNLVAAFSGGENLQKKDIDELREYIEKCENELK